MTPVYRAVRFYTTSVVKSSRARARRLAHHRKIARAQQLLGHRRAADLAVFQDTGRTVELEGGALATVLLSDHDSLVGGVGGDVGEQGGDHEALDHFGRRQFGSLRVA